MPENALKLYEEDSLYGHWEIWRTLCDNGGLPEDAYEYGIWLNGSLVQSSFWVYTTRAYKEGPSSVKDRYLFLKKMDS